MKKSFISYVFIGLLFLGCSSPQAEKQKQSSKPILPSWNDGPTKQAIIDFVTKSTTKGGSDFIPIKDRIATFDNDGNLWSEQPVYFQLLYAMDQIKAMAPDHPEWKNEQPYKAILEGDVKTALAGGEKALLQIVMASHGGVTSEEFSKSVKEWLASTTHPKTGKHYNEMIYQPMVELLEYLRANDFKTFIVSGGGVDFMRVWVEEAYGIPPHQVVGSSNKASFEVDANGNTSIVKQPELNFIDDKAGKPVGIHQYIGKRPVFASGNSDGDYQMLQWTTTAKGYPRFGLLLHHTDADREWAYDRESHIGQLNKGLDDAAKFGWTVIDMKKDWNKVFPFDK